MAGFSVVHAWWYCLSAVALLNVGLWLCSAVVYLRGQESRAAEYAGRLPHLILSGVYVLVCAFRSALPRADVQRIVVYDSWLSSVLVGRSVATVAELCFAAQWALLLRELAREHHQPLALTVSRLIMPLIVVAELFSWYAVLSTSYLGNSVEQSLWTLTVALLSIALVPLYREVQGALRSFLGVSIVLCGGFVVFMCTVDIPMYLSRWIADEASGRAYLTFSAVLHDLATRWVVTHELSVWREELAWMALYFSVAVWFSIALLHAPRVRARSLSPRPREAAPVDFGVPAE